MSFGGRKEKKVFAEKGSTIACSSLTIFAEKYAIVSTKFFNWLYIDYIYSLCNVFAVDTHRYAKLYLLVYCVSYFDTQRAVWVANSNSLWRCAFLSISMP